MIKRLRHRSTAMITAILTIVMTVVCIVIYVSMYRSEEQRAERTIRAAMSVRLELPPMPPSEQDAPKSDPPEKDTSEKDTSEKDERRPGRPSSGEGFRPDVRFDRGGFFPAADPTRIGTGWVRIDIDDDGSIRGIFMSQRSSEDEDEFPAETAAEAVSRILASGTKEGKIIAGDVRYSYAYDEQRRAVVLLDRQNSI
ncbi:MAG: hypothetical protein IKR73_03855, partial [Oscillospiraceae bacterium]|nr:hypothetical protein [Oscillospiraceae bacterium]